MIALDTQNCCGCNACVASCPQQCIMMVEDEEGFLYPKIDTQLCNGCNLCQKVCPALNQNEPQLPLVVYAARNTNEEQRQESSSGGVFVQLAYQVIQQGGVVFGARFDSEWNVVHAFAETTADIAPLMRSKYVQSRIGDTYKQAQDFLRQGRLVLFTGTPCQIQGLRNFLHKGYDNLITVDFICHGVPSPKVWHNYLNEITPNIHDITSINFRAKQSYGYSWLNFGIVIKGKDTNLVHEPICDNAYMQGFLQNFYLRPSCHICPAKEGRSHSDITIADYWRIWEDYPELDDQKGTSLLMVNTEKGNAIINTLTLQKTTTSLSHAQKNNPTWAQSYPCPKEHALFFNEWSQNNSLTQTIRYIQEYKERHKPMRIGILTHWQTLDNYGQVLQYLSLQHILKQLGHEPFVIRYDLEGHWLCNYDEQQRQDALRQYANNDNNGREFNDFRLKYFHFSPRLYQTLSQLKEMPPEADAYIVGSDQIWGLMLHDPENKAYWLDFGEKDIKRIAYAPSFGPNPCPPVLQPLATSLLMHFSGISCREHSGVELLHSMGFNYAKKALDPTLLPTIDFFNDLCDDSLDIKRPYIYVYSINIASAEQLRWAELQEFAYSHNWDIIVTTGSGYVPGKRLFEGVTYVEATIPQWLWLIDNAEMVVTPSFHGIVFSLLFHTQMVYVPLQGQMAQANNRVTDLFSDLGITGHELTEQTTYTKLYEQFLSWDVIEEHKKNEVTTSLDFLTDALERRIMTISIITINYNNANGLRNTITSVINQTSHDYEYIVIDGNSTDGSKEVLDEFKDKIDYWVSEPDNGIYNAMNKGIAQARGKYCLFMNSGDVLAKTNVIETVIPRLASDKDFYSGIEIMSGGKVTTICPPPPADFDFGFLFESSFRHQSTFIRTSLLKQRPYKEQYRIVSDWECTLYWLIVKNASYEPIDTVIALFDTTNSLSNSEQASQIVKAEQQQCYEELFPYRLVEYLSYKPSRTKDEALAVQLPEKLYKKILRSSELSPVKRDLKIIRNVFKQLLKDIF